MDKKNENKEDDVPQDIEQYEEFAPLRALSSALTNRIPVSTSRIQVGNASVRSASFVGIEGPQDPETLALLEEAVLDIICLYDDRESLTSRSTTSENQNAPDKTDKDSGKGHPSTSRNDSFDSIPSANLSFDDIVDPESLQKAEEAITDIENSGPAGLPHLSSLSNAVGKPIRIWCSSTDESRKIGRTKTGEPIDIEYHEPRPGQTHGHYTLPGNREPCHVEAELNDCLFAVVAAQCNRLAPELRKATVECMLKNVKALGNRIRKICELEKCGRISLLLGGARYTGSRPQDAKKVIDNSQHGTCHPSGMHGHPRGHASHPGATGPTDSAENYSHTGMKSAFLSREDQDAVGHLALETPQAQRAMEALNRGETISIAINVRPEELRPGPLPRGVEFVNGERYGDERPFRQLVLVLRHHQGQQNNPDADVFVHTFYPKLQ